MVYNNDITITCQVRSLTAPNITWTTNATAGIVGQSDVMSQGEIHTRDLVLTGVTLDSIGLYTCTATNQGGSINTNAMLTVNGKDFRLYNVHVHQNAYISTCGVTVI